MAYLIGFHRYPIRVRSELIAVNCDLALPFMLLRRSQLIDGGESSMQIREVITLKSGTVSLSKLHNDLFSWKRVNYSPCVVRNQAFSSAESLSALAQGDPD